MLKKIKKQFFIIKEIGFKQYFKNNFLRNNSSKQIIIKNSFWYFLTEAFDKVVKFVITILLARYLGVEGYGRYNFAFAFTSIFIILDNFGLSSLAIREIGKHKNIDYQKVLDYISNLFLLKIVLSILTFLVIFGISSIAIQVEFKRNLIIIFAVYFIFFNFNQFINSLYVGFERLEFHFIINNINIFLNLIIVAVCIFLKVNIIYILLYQSVIYLITSFINFCFVKKIFIKSFSKIDLKVILYILKESWPLALGFIFTTIYLRIDTVMLSYLKGDEAVGIYSAAYRLFLVYQTVLYIIHQVVFPRFSEFFQKKDFDRYRLLMKKIFKYSVILIFITILITILSKVIIFIIYGQKYSDSYIILSILVWCGMIIFYNQFWGNSLVIMNKQKLQTVIFAVGAGINIILNFILIIPYSYIGATIATVLTEIIVSILMYLFSSKEFRLKKILLTKNIG